MENFESSGLNPEILQAIADLGFETPTPIQAKTLQLIIDSDRDVVGLAQTGTGKTAAFSLPILQQIDPDFKGVQCIILCPTRELCLQIHRDIETYSKYMQGVSAVAVYGGAGIDQQIRQIKKGPQIIVGTPGRTLDMINRKKLDLSAVNWLVLDEADEMLSMGFKDELDAILEAVPEERQTLLFSATMPKEVARIAKNYMHDPETITTTAKQATTGNVSHAYFMVKARDRYLALKRLVDYFPGVYAIIFCRTKMETKEVADKLMADGYNADALHGDLSQSQRDYVMNRFRNRQLQLLVATDVAARGLDVNDLTHVINYNLPDETEVYIHRSGRTGRAGKLGESYVIIHSRETGKIRQIEKKMGKNMEKREIPAGEEICEKQLYYLIDKMKEVSVNDHQIEKYLPTINEKLSGFNREELVKRFVSAEFNRFLDYYKNAKDLNISGKFEDEDSRRSSRKDRGRRRDRDRDRGERRSRRDRRNPGDGSSVKENGFITYKINLGKKDRITPGSLLSLINEFVPDRNVQIGRIEINKSNTFFGVDDSYPKDMSRFFKNAKYKGVHLEMKKA